MLTKAMLAGAMMGTIVMLAAPGYCQQGNSESGRSASPQDTRYLVYMRGIT